MTFHFSTQRFKYPTRKPSNKYRLARFLAPVLLALSSMFSYAEELIVLSAGADPWPPYIDETLPKGGISVQIADAALQTQGYTVINKILPWARAIEETKSGNLDLILDAWWSQERSTFFSVGPTLMGL